MIQASQLLQTFRARIKDDRHVVPRFTMRYRDRQTRSALLDVSNDVFRVTLRGATQGMAELAIPLHDQSYSTLGQLVAHIEGTYGKTYEIQRAQQFSETHMSMDLETVISEDITDGSPFTFHTRLFSDDELLSILLQAVKRHNPGFTLDTVPDAEENMIYQLAAAELLRIKAVDASKRRGFEDDPKAMMAQAESYEFAYRQDISRLRNVIELPGGSRQTPNHQGDVNQTACSRFSLRTGRQSPSSRNLAPQKPILVAPDGNDVEDYAVVVRWEKMNDLGDDFSHLEMWRDVTPDVRRTKDQELFPTTSVCVWNSAQCGPQSGEALWANAGNTRNITDGFVLAIAKDGAPQQTDMVRALAPDTMYFYRLFVFDRNGEYEASDAMPVTTKPARGEFSRNVNSPLSVAEGPRAGGTVVEVEGANFVTGMRVMVGAKEAVSVDVVSDTQLLFTTPNAGLRGPACENVTLISPSGLRDIYAPWRWVD